MEYFLLILNKMLIVFYKIQCFLGTQSLSKMAKLFEGQGHMITAQIKVIFYLNIQKFSYLSELLVNFDELSIKL